MTDDAPLSVVDVSSVIRSAYILSHIKKMLEIIDEAETIYASFPRTLKDQISCDTCGEDEDLQGRAKGEIALAIAQLSPQVRQQVRRMMEETQLFASNPSETHFYGMLDEQDVMLIEEMVVFVQKVGRRSSRQLLSFLRGASEGERGYLLIESHGRQSEIRHAHYMTAVARAEFDL